MATMAAFTGNEVPLEFVAQDAAYDVTEDIRTTEESSIPALLQEYAGISDEDVKRQYADALNMVGSLAIMCYARENPDVTLTQ